MAALVQSYPQQSTTVTMLQTRPSSASGIIHSSQAPAHHQYPTNRPQMQRNSFHGMNPAMAISSYRGHTAMTPIAPYAFTSTPNLATPGQRTQTTPHLRPELRTSSAPIVPTESGVTTNRSRYPATPSVSTTSSTSSSDLSSLSQKSGSKDDSAITGTARVVSGTPIARPHSTIITSNSFQQPSSSSPVKPAPDRYRRPNNRRAESSTTGQSSTAQASIPQASTVQQSPASNMPNFMQFYGASTQTAPQIPPIPSYQGMSAPMSHMTGSIGNTAGVKSSSDDMVLNRHISQDQAAKRYRRRSIHTIDAADYGHMSGGFQQQGSRQVSSANGRIDHQQHPLRSSPVGLRPGSSHGRNGSSESVNSARSSHSGPNSVGLDSMAYTALLQSHLLFQFNPHQSNRFNVHFANNTGRQARGKRIHGIFKPRPIFIFAISSCKCARRPIFNQTRCT